jgi:AcrR family transcriptional regulator
LEELTENRLTEKKLTERQRRRREDILAAARVLIAERGYDGVTMRDLARASGVAPKTLYHQFDNKENLLRAAVEERFRHAYQQIDEADIARGIDRLFYIIDTVGATTRDNLAYARALGPILSSRRSKSSEVFTLIRMNTYRKAIQQIHSESEFVDWVDVDLLSAIVYRQVNPILMSSWFLRTPSDVTTMVVKLDLCLILGAVTTGYTHRKVIATAKKLQTTLKGNPYV